jgi:CheY-like chemotaxis protein
VAHDFNNLLMAITGSLSLLRREVPGDARSLRHVERMEAAAEKLSGLTSQLLAIAQGGRMDFQDVSPSDLVDDTLPLFRGTTGRHCSVLLGVGPDVWPIRGDRAQLRQVLLNLVQNASEASEEGGVVWIRASNLTRDEPFRCELTGTHPAGDYVRVTVEDDGSGMDETTRGRLFEPYFSTRSGRSGLGLAAVLGIVRRHGGAIEVVSEVGKGTTVELLLPRGESGAAAGGARPGESAATRAVVLIVDDEPVVREVAGEMLTELGYDVRYAESGPHALDVYREAGGEVALVLLDVVMPGMSGVETCRRLFEIDAEARIVFSSGNTENLATRDSDIASRTLGFLQKPYRIEELEKVLSRALAG